MRAIKGEFELSYELTHEYLIPRIDKWISKEEREVRVIREVMERERTICEHLKSVIPMDRARFLKLHIEKANFNERDIELIERSIKEGESQNEKVAILKRQLIVSQRMEAIGTLAGGIAHDFNNILGGIMGHTSLIIANADSSDLYYEHLRGIESFVNDAAHLTQQLMGFAKGGKYEAKPTDLNELIKQSSRMFGRTKKEISIHTQLKTDLWHVNVDQSQLEQVLLNLLMINDNYYFPSTTIKIPVFSPS